MSPDLIDRRAERCLGSDKVRFVSRDAAEAELDHLARSVDDDERTIPHTSYRCAHCNDWHLTSGPPPPWLPADGTCSTDGCDETPKTVLVEGWLTPVEWHCEQHRPAFTSDTLGRSLLVVKTLARRFEKDEPEAQPAQSARSKPFGGFWSTMEQAQRRDILSIVYDRNARIEDTLTDCDAALAWVQTGELEDEAPRRALVDGDGPKIGDQVQLRNVSDDGDWFPSHRLAFERLIAVSRDCWTTIDDCGDENDYGVAEFDIRKDQR